MRQRDLAVPGGSDVQGGAPPGGGGLRPPSLSPLPSPPSCEQHLAGQGLGGRLGFGGHAGGGQRGPLRPMLSSPVGETAVWVRVTDGGVGGELDQRSR